jgi:NAD-dependent dihydropyrimidine dehydrogenase PreA subunit
MIRDVVKIDEELCNGCGQCVPGCHEGALQVIDGKARLINDLLCDGLGACIGHCPQGAITIEKREAEPYNEKKVMQLMMTQGKNTIAAHLKHLKDHNEFGFFKEGIRYLNERKLELDFSLDELLTELSDQKNHSHQQSCGSACPGTREKSFTPGNLSMTTDVNEIHSELRQWPVQLHLLNPQAGYFQNADLLIAADCSAFAVGNFHRKFLRGKTLAIACPKLDSNLEAYVEKISAMIDLAHLNTITVLMMEVPCCNGLFKIVQMAVQKSSKKVPVKAIVVSNQGEVLQEEWT